jgi:hypothetical protein
MSIVDSAGHLGGWVGLLSVVRACRSRSGDVSGMTSHAQPDPRRAVSRFPTRPSPSPSMPPTSRRATTLASSSTAELGLTLCVSPLRLAWPGGQVSAQVTVVPTGVTENPTFNATLDSANACVCSRVLRSRSMNLSAQLLWLECGRQQQLADARRRCAARSAA